MLTECSEGNDRCRDLRPQAGVDMPRPTPLSWPAHRPGSHGTCCAGQGPRRLPYKSGFEKCTEVIKLFAEPDQLMLRIDILSTLIIEDFIPK